MKEYQCFHRKVDDWDINIMFCYHYPKDSWMVNMTGPNFQALTSTQFDTVTDAIKFVTGVVEKKRNEVKSLETCLQQVQMDIISTMVKENEQQL